MNSPYLQGLYEAELADARKLLDETAKEKAHLQIEVGKWKAEADDLAAKLAKRDAEADALHKSLKDAEKKISVSCYDENAEGSMKPQ